MAGTKRETSRGVVSESLRAKRRRKTRRALISYVMAFGVLYAGAWHLAHHPSFAIAKIEVGGNEVSSTADVEAAARAALASPVLSILPMTNAYLARAGRIEASVEEALPEVATATVQREGLDLVVTVEERTRFGYWCRVSTGGAEECFALDPDGLIFASEAAPWGATRFSGLVGAADPIRASYSTGESWDNLAGIVAGLRARGLSPANVSTEDGIDFKITLAEGPYLLADATQPADQAIGNLAIALDDESLASLTSYLYADLRLPHKVFLRSRDSGQSI